MKITILILVLSLTLLTVKEVSSQEWDCETAVQNALELLKETAEGTVVNTEPVLNKEIVCVPLARNIAGKVVSYKPRTIYINSQLVRPDWDILGTIIHEACHLDLYEAGFVPRDRESVLIHEKFCSYISLKAIYYLGGPNYLYNQWLLKLQYPERYW